MIAATLRKAWALLTVNYAHMLEYRGEIFFWMIATIWPLIMMGPWMEISASGQMPLTTSQFARYFIAVFVVRQFSICWVIYEFEFHVVSGRLSSMLLAPLDPAWRFVSAHLGEQMARVPFVVGMVALALWLFPQAIWDAAGVAHWPPISRVALAVLATYLAFALRFLMQYTLAMGSFWVERVAAFDRVQMILYIAFSGLSAPLEVFPPWIEQLVRWTPFPYLVWFPASLLTGADIGPIWHGFAIVCGWIFLVWVLNRLLWRAGIKRYSAMGA